MNRYSYTCRSGCCTVRIIPAVKRGIPGEVYLDGIRGTFASHAAALGRPAEVIRERSKHGTCWKCDNPQRLSSPQGITSEAKTREMTALANRFLRLPRVA